MSDVKENLIDSFGRLKAESKVVVLLSALDYMQEYNGRSVRDCIALSMRDYQGSEASDYEIINN